MKFAAIDIGSNAVRFQISRPLTLKEENPLFKRVEYTRLPLRLGDDVFTLGKLSDGKVDLLIKSMKAFVYLMEIFDVDGHMACATSAMRDADNAAEVLARIEKETGIKINVLGGLEESEIIRNAVLDDLPTRQGYMHIDVGGGSTEVSFIKNGKLIVSESFNVGTVRMFKGADLSKENEKMKKWVKQNSATKTDWKSLGSGGNINKIYKLINDENAGWISRSQIKYKLKVLGKMSKQDRVFNLSLNPDRAEVIDYAGIIYTNIMGWAGSEKMYVSGKGLKEGMIKEMWRNYLAK